MSTSNQKICLWVGMAMMPLLFLGFGLFAKFIPPPAPSASAVTIAHMYASNRTGIRIGMFIATAAGALLCFLFAVIATQLKRIEGRHSTLMYVQLLAGACTVLEFILPPLFWQNAAFRADRAAATVQTLNDLAWLPFLGITGTLLAQQVVIAIATLRDKRAEPILPRWTGYANLWAALAIVPASFVVFTHTGPLAWNGVLAFWLVLVDFFVWMCLIAYSMNRAINHQAREERDHVAEPTIAQLASEVAALRSQLADDRRPSVVTPISD
jgi:hypothetical protein